MKKINLFFLVSFFVVFFDQLSKFFIRKTFQPVCNPGAGFGILQNSTSLLIWFSVFVVGLIIYYYDEIPSDRLSQLSFALILGGAVGNLIDRVFFGCVIDFISIGWWPSFNIADSAITIGAVLLGYYWYVDSKKKN